MAVHPVSFFEDITPAAVLSAYKRAAQDHADVRAMEYMLGWPGVLQWWLAVVAPSVRKLRRLLPPFPPDRLREITAEPELPLFLWTGLIDTQLVMRLFDEHRSDPRQEPVRVLDFGCGCGRMTRHLAMRPEKWRVYGCEVNPEHVAWCQRHLPNVQTSRVPEAPPTGYADAQFDLIFCFSVFTHLPEVRAGQWLHEFARILAPDGIFIMTTHGVPALQTIRRSQAHQQMFGMTSDVAAEVLEHFERDPYRFFPYPVGVLERARAGNDYGSTFIHPNYIHKEWGRRARPTTRRKRTP